MAFVLTGCSTYQYTARTMGVDRQTIGTRDIALEVVPDYGSEVSATSDYQQTKNDAINEAAHRCIIDNDIDVIVDPIVKIERTPFRLQKRYKATVTGFSGTYKQASAGVEAASEYDKEDIEKYKLLSDPDFAKYYYSKGVGDTYYINSSSSSVSKESLPAPLAFAPKIKKKAVKEFDFTKARKLRNAGMGLTIAGVVSTFVIGLPCYLTDSGPTYRYNYGGYGGYYDYSTDSDGQEAGIAFFTIGAAAVVAGIPMWCIGARRMKNSDRDMALSVGGTQSGVGLRFNF